ncbi:MAG: TetR/AcrR family transcriptional regulator [Verrucomicrobiae bacterium]|nr:TetR/AcrR family transcriptional regulator [Verrucomicrobiae bacterium]
MDKNETMDRKTRILDAAEQVFGNSGFDGASLRQIVQAARVNLATVYYYFESKEHLLEEVFKRRLGPVKEEQLASLRQVERRGLKGMAAVEKILEAMLFPALRLTASADLKRSIPTKLIGRVVADPNPRFQELIRSQHDEVRHAFIAALQRRLPKCSIADLAWRMELVWGALAFLMCNPDRVKRAADGEGHSVGARMALAQMTAFFSTGLCAPAAKRNPPAR